MANSLLTIDMITRKALQILENNLVITRNVNRQYDDSFAVEGAKPFRHNRAMSGNENYAARTWSPKTPFLRSNRKWKS